MSARTVEPSEARLIAYMDAVSECEDPQPCEYGHFGCALREGGRCADEVFHQLPVERRRELTGEALR